MKRIYLTILVVIVSLNLKAQIPPPANFDNDPLNWCWEYGGPVHPSQNVNDVLEKALENWSGLNNSRVLAARVLTNGYNLEIVNGGYVFYYGNKSSFYCYDLWYGINEYSARIEIDWDYGRGTTNTQTYWIPFYVIKYNDESELNVTVSNTSVNSGSTVTLTPTFKYNGSAINPDHVYESFKWDNVEQTSTSKQYRPSCRTNVTFEASNGCFSKPVNATITVTYTDAHAGSISANTSTACYGDDAEYIRSVSEFNGGNNCTVNPEYQWKYRNESTDNNWVEIPGANYDDYNPTQILLTDTEYRRDVTINGTQTLKSNVVTITVAYPNPGTITVNYGSTKCYNSPVTLENLTSPVVPGNSCPVSYKWEMADNQSFTSNKEVLGGRESESAVTPNITADKWFRRNIIVNGKEIEGTPVLVDIDIPNPGSISIADVTICKGAAAGQLTSTLGATNNNGFTGYQWSYSYNGSPYSYIDINGANSITHTDNTPIENDFKYFVREAKSICPNIPDEYSKTTYVMVEAKDRLDGGTVVSAKNQYCFNENVSDLSVNANNGTRTLTYEWELDIENTSGDFDDNINTWFSGADKSTENLDLPSAVNTEFYNAIKTYGGATFRRIIQEDESGCTATSSEYRLTSYPDITGGGIGTHDLVICESDNVNDLPTIGNDNNATGGDGSYVYSWEYKNSGSNTWNTISGANGIDLRIDSKPGVTRSYRRKVHDECLSVAHNTAKYSNPVTINYKDISINGVLRDTEQCESEQLIINAPPNFTDYEWNLNNTAYSYGMATFTKTFLETSDRSLGLRVTDADGCKAETSMNITVNALPRFTMPTLHVCEGETAIAEAPGGYMSYSFEGKPSSSNNRTVYTYAEVINDSEKSVTVRDSKGCNSDNIPFSVFAEQLPVINLNNDYVCRGEIKRISINANPFVTNITWSDDNGVIASGPATYFIEVSPEQTTRYYVTVENQYCSAEASMILSVRENPSIALRDTFACYGSEIELSAEDNYLKHYWNTNNGMDNKNTKFTVRNNLYTTLRVEDVYGCTITDTMNISVKQLPVFAGPEAQGCIRELVTLNAPAGYEYLWEDGEISQSITREVKDFGHPDNTINITITDGFGCQKTEEAHILTKPSPGAPSITTQFVCEGEDNVLSLYNSYDSYFWSSGETSPSITINKTQDEQMYVKVGNNFGCYDSTIFDVIVNEVPEFELEDTTKCNDGNLLRIESPISGSNLQYQWSNYSLNSSALFNLSSSATLWLEVTKGICSHRDSFNVEVFDIPQVMLPDTNICFGDTLNYTYMGEYSELLWSTGDVTANISKKITNSTSYSLTVTDDNGCMGNDLMSVTRLNLPTVFISGRTRICEGDEVQLSIPSSFPTTEWTNGKTTPTINEQPLADSTYGVYVEDINGCSASDAITVVVNRNPVGTLKDTAICEGNFAILKQDGNNLHLEWSTGASGNNVLFKPNNSVNIYLTMTDMNGCVGYDSLYISVNSNPYVNIPSESVCEGDSVLLQSIQRFPYMAWTTGDTTQSIWYTPTNAMDNVTFNYSDENGCSGETNLTVQKLSVIPFSVQPKSICEGATTSLSAQNGFVSYLWSNGETTSTILVSPDETTDFDVVVTDINGCSVTKESSVSVNPNPEVEIDNISICPNLSATVTAPIGNYAYSWSNGVTSRYVSIGYAAAGNYSVTVTDRSSNCSTTDDFEVYAVPVPNVYFSDTTICNSQVIAYDLPEHYSYVWPDGISNGFKEIAPSTNTNYNIAIIDSFNCTAERQFSVTVLTAPRIIIDNQVLCNESTIDLDVPFANGFDYSWSNGSTSTSNTFNNLVDTTIAWVKAENFQCSVTDSFLIINQVMPVLNLGNEVICYGDTLFMEMPSGFNYYWSTKETTQSTFFTEAGTQFVTLTTEHGCEEVYEFNTSIETIELTMTVDSATLNLGNTTALNATATGSENISIEWKINDDEFLGNRVNFSPADTGLVNVFVKAESSNGCNSFLNMHGYIQVLDTVSLVSPVDTSNNELTDINSIKTMSIGIYPNPATEFLNIDTRDYSTDNEIKFSILDINGRVIMSQQIEPANVNHIDVNSLQEGYYVLLLDVNGLTKMSRIIIER